MSVKLQEKLQNLKNNNKKFFIPFITAGFPSLEITEKLVIALEEAGADAIELGIPFSDPLADGPTIQYSSCKALESGANIFKILDMVERLRKITQIPLVFMTYYNPIYKYGVEKFVADASLKGVSGIIVPDLPPEEAKVLIKSAKEHDLAITFLFTPTSSDERIKLITNSSTGFIYYVSLAGVTGAREAVSSSIQQKIEIARKYTKKPIAVGFGISTSIQASEVAKFADGVIVGSAIIKEIIACENKSQDEIINRVKAFSVEISNAVHNS